ncbi:hypothetical protein [Pseudomonas putida]|uniref:hypothetical protein n=1 Tax=Pseudomonas putida TaxID=303 RepID=UPI0021F84492|nr:hypothetical protein [Pseudomonas putida]
MQVTGHVECKRLVSINENQWSSAVQFPTQVFILPGEGTLEQYRTPILKPENGEQVKAATRQQPTQWANGCLGTFQLRGGLKERGNQAAHCSQLDTCGRFHSRPERPTRHLAETVVRHLLPCVASFDG